MSHRTSFVFLALAVAAAPLSAQIIARSPARDRVITRTGGDVVGTRTSDDARSRDRIPPGQLPPPGSCRVWIDGVPPGQQPPVTDCATAERNRVANSRVIYGDREAFPGRGKGATRRARNDDDDDRGKREAKALRKANKERAKAAAKQAKQNKRGGDRDD